MKIQRGMQSAAITLALMLLLGLAGCGTGSEEGADDQGGSVTTSFQLDLSSILDDINVNQGQQAAAVENQVTASGQLMIVPFNGAPLPVFPFEVILEPGSLILTTGLKVDLDPSLYTFYMLLNLSVNNTNGKYAGVAPVLIVDGGDNIVHMTLNPLLVSFGIKRVEDLRNMSSFVVNFPENIDTYSDPRFGISIDGGPEVVFKINVQSNTSRKVTIYLPYRETPYIIDQCFFDGSLVKQCAISDPVPPPPPSNPPTEVPTEPVQAEVTYSLTPDSTGANTASFYVPIPAQVLAEVGGGSTETDPLANRLKIVFTVVGSNTTVTEQVLSLDPWQPIPDPPGFADGGTVTLQNFAPGPITWSLSFYQRDPVANTVQQIAYCANDFNLAGLDPAKASLLCDLVLVDGEIIVENPVSNLTVTVFDTTNNVSVEGAVVTVNGVEVGITGDGTDGPFGTMDLFLPGGTYDFQATAEGITPSGVLSVDVASGQTGLNVTLNVIGPDVTSPGDVANLVATPGNGTVILEWANPTDSDLTNVRIVRTEAAGPVDPKGDTQPAWDQSAVPGAIASFTDTNAENGVTFYYSVFTKDGAGNYSGGVQISATPVAPPSEPPPSLDEIVLTPSRSVRPREFMDDEANLNLGENEVITVEIPSLEDLTVLDGSTDHFLLVLYIGDVKCMYLGGTRDRHLGGMMVEWEEAFHKAFRSPACHEGEFKKHHSHHQSTHGHHRRDGRISEGTVTTDGPIRARVVTGHPRYPITTVEVRIPVVGITTRSDDD